MKTWKIIQIYHVQAESKKEGLEIFHKGEPEKFFTVEFAVLSKATGFWSVLREQILG